MEGRRRPYVLLLAGAAAVAALLFLASGPRPPRLPADAHHEVSQAESQCLSCHGYGKVHPRPADHPLRDDCYSCHHDAGGVLHPRPDAPTSIPGGWRDDPRLLAKVHR